MAIKYFPELVLGLALGLSACGGGGGGSSSSAVSPTATVAPASTPPTSPVPLTGSVTISGKITFDSVPHNVMTNGLNYANISKAPARGITIEAVNSDGIIMQAVKTDEYGDYVVSVDSDTDIRILAKAKMVQSGAAQWDVRVSDNTADNALYVLQGSLINSGTEDQIRDLNAASGWDGSTYSAQRAAAPFAILNPIYDGLQKLAAIDPDINLPAMEFRWSVNNRAAAGELSDGDIETSFYEDGNIYLLGSANGDTDEYDPHVIVHEWSHYIEEALSRTDSIGGNHSSADRLDPRVAFGEGFGNALAAMILDDPIYRDSLGWNQNQGFMLDVERNAYGNPGWFNEGSVQSLLYDIYDGDDDGVDSLTLGLGPIYRALTTDRYKNTDVFTSLFTFMDALKLDQSENIESLERLLLAQNITGTGPMGAGESNDGGVETALPVFKSMQVGGEQAFICSGNKAGRYNKLGNRDWVYFTIPSAGRYTLSANRAGGRPAGNPDFDVYRNGKLIISAKAGDDNIETWTGDMESGSYVIDAYDNNNLEFAITDSRDICFHFTLTQ